MVLDSVIKIAYDLDGVLVPDCDHIPFIKSLDDFYGLTMYMKPLFNPQGSYAIITARPAEYRSATWTWCNRHLEELPERLFHECLDETPGAYKARILKENANIQMYVESDEGIVKYLRNNVDTGCEIVFFDDYLSQLFRKDK